MMTMMGMTLTCDECYYRTWSDARKATDDVTDECKTDNHEACNDVNDDDCVKEVHDWKSYDNSKHVHELAGRNDVKHDENSMNDNVKSRKRKRARNGSTGWTLNMNMMMRMAPLTILLYWACGVLEDDRTHSASASHDANAGELQRRWDTRRLEFLELDDQVIDIIPLALLEDAESLKTTEAHDHQGHCRSKGGNNTLKWKGHSEEHKGKRTDGNHCHRLTYSLTCSDSNCPEHPSSCNFGPHAEGTPTHPDNTLEHFSLVPTAHGLTRDSLAQLQP